ncbi:phage tail tube protein [Erythrobacter sp. CCH5-A1]|jgi:predicted secreted protein|uniref:phage tail tube protein n=1 Tax=Erythrobacter sp. CCH5-A1 TaxID=1768792 RepID=UPI00082D5BC7|nr:phage tail tube protein [Erythrobacter sp. CCH5-A1]
MAGKHGFGAKFFIGNPTTLLEISDVMSVTPPSPTVETIDTTVHGSAGGVREFIAGLIEAGEGSIRVNWLPGSASDTALTGALLSRSVRPWKINVPAATASRDFTGNCVVTGYEKDDVVIDDKMTAVLTFKVSGQITEAAGT